LTKHAIRQKFGPLQGPIRAKAHPKSIWRLVARLLGLVLPAGDSDPVPLTLRIIAGQKAQRVPPRPMGSAFPASGTRPIAVAERQSAKLFQLRISTSLARLWRDQSRRAEAHDLLAPIAPASPRCPMARRGGVRARRGGVRCWSGAWLGPVMRNRTAISAFH